MYKNKEDILKDCKWIYIYKVYKGFDDILNFKRYTNTEDLCKIQQKINFELSKRQCIRKYKKL